MVTENTPKDYVSIRVSVVRVKKKFGLFTEKEIGKHICIPNTWEDADKLVGEISEIIKKYGDVFSPTIIQK